jgi:hypothetical protein
MDNELLTMGELLKRSEGVPLDAIVMIKCGDEYYNGPAAVDTAVGEACKIAPFEYNTPNEDEYGRRIESRVKTASGGWYMKEDVDERHTVVARRPAFVLKTGD